MVKKFANRESGFTWMEAIGSRALLAVISVMSYQAVEVVTKVNERSRSGVASEKQLQRAWQIIGRDLMHIRPRRFHDGLGDIEGAYLTNPSDFGVRFSRGGGPMLRTIPRGMRRVKYSINKDDQLVRTSWAITESPRQSDGTTLILLDKVQDVEFNQLEGNGNYSVDWPPLNSRQTDKALPRMISVTIITENEVETSRLFPGVASE